MHGVETMAWVGDRPWHGLGVEITEDEKEIQRNVPAFMRKAGIDWKARKVSTRYGYDHPIADMQGKGIPNQYQIVRETDGALLSTTPVTDNSYNIRQNSTMAEVLQPFLDDNEMTLNTGGSLFNGRKVWILCKMKSGFEVTQDDVVNNFLLYTIDHSGACANSAFYTPIRVVCNNTMRMAMFSSKYTMTDNHKAAFNVEDMRQALQTAKDQSVDFEELCIRMQNYSLSDEKQKTFFRNVYNWPKVNKRDELKENFKVVRAIALMHGEDVREGANAHNYTSLDLSQTREYKTDSNVNKGWQLAENTLWGAYNTVTWIEDHAPLRRTKPDNMLNRAFYGGQKEDYKVKALAVAKELIAA